MASHDYVYQPVRRNVVRRRRTDPKPSHVRAMEKTKEASQESKRASNLAKAQNARATCKSPRKLPKKSKSATSNGGGAAVVPPSPPKVFVELKSNLDDIPRPLDGDEDAIGYDEDTFASFVGRGMPHITQLFDTEPASPRSPETTHGRDGAAPTAEDDPSDGDQVKVAPVDDNVQLLHPVIPFLAIITDDSVVSERLSPPPPVSQLSRQATQRGSFSNIVKPLDQMSRINHMQRRSGVALTALWEPRPEGMLESRFEQINRLINRDGD